MIRIEIIGNQAVEEDIIEIFGRRGLGDSFTYLYPVYGRGRHGRREGSAIWPEENVLFLLYIEDESTLDGLLSDLKEVKRKFGEEGLRCYVGRNVDRVL